MKFGFDKSTHPLYKYYKIILRKRKEKNFSTYTWQVLKKEYNENCERKW